jgi:N-acetylglucosamine-6-phosphate deacetylase
MGCDVMDGSFDSLDTIARFHLRNGTTTFLATTLTAPLERLEAVLEIVECYRAARGERAGDGGTAGVAGVHLEGPWISRRNLGAQNGRYVIAPGRESLSLVRRYAGLLRLVTFSYHGEEARALLELLVELGIEASLGHDQTLDADAVAAFASGVRHLTHAYSNSSSFQRRSGVKHLGSLEMALITPGVTVELIADDRHIRRPFWEFVRHNKPIEEIIVVSDSTSGAGLPEDPTRVHKLGELDTIIDDGVAWLADRSAYAGSVSPLHSCLRVLVDRWKVPMADAARTVSSNPAKSIGLYPELGCLAAGSLADVVFLNDDLSIAAVLKSGRLVDPR